MKAKKYWILAVLVAGVFAVACWGVGLEDERRSLVGLEGVEVVVEGLPPIAEKYGLTKLSLQTDVELRLRQNGIRVLSTKERLQTPGMPYLYLNVNVFQHSENPLITAVSVSISLNQNVLLRRNPNILCHGVTWEHGSLIVVGSLRLKEVRENIKGHVDIFINNYLAANPKTRGK